MGPNNGSPSASPSDSPRASDQLPPLANPVPLRQPAPLRPGEVGSPVVGGLPPLASLPSTSSSSSSSPGPSFAPFPKHHPHHHHHQRSRSVNLSPIMRSSSFAAPPVSTPLSWDNVELIRKRSSSPLNLPGANKGTIDKSRWYAASGGTFGDHAQSHSPSHSRSQSQSGPSSLPSTSTSSLSLGSPDAKRPSFERTPASPPGQRPRTASPARAYRTPTSPHLQAMGARRDRRSGSSSSTSSSGSANASSSPVSPHGLNAPLIVNPDPEHPFDSVWPAEATSSSSSAAAPPSSSSSPRGRGLSPTPSHWPMDRDGSRSPDLQGISSPARPIAVNGSGGPSLAAGRTLRSSGSASSLSPVYSRGSHFERHRRSWSNSSSGSSSSSPREASTSPSSPSYANAVRTAGSEEPSPTSPGGSSASSSTRLNPTAKVLSRTKSSVQVDPQSVHADTGSRSDAQDSVTDMETQTSDAKSPAAPPDDDSEGASQASPRPTSYAQAAAAAEAASQESAGDDDHTAALAESPPKTRSFIGMPPRSGYELSDDPDDVGSEDGASASSERDSVSTVDDDERYMDDVDADADAHADDANVDSDSDQEPRDRDESASDAHTSDSRDDAGEDGGTESAMDDDRQDNADDGGADGQGSDEMEGQGTAASPRPALPKRPSLTRSSVVPLSPAPPLPPPSGVSMLRYFDETQSPAGQGSASDAEQPLERDGNDALLETEPAVASSDGGVEVLAEEGEVGPDSNAAALTEAMEQPEESLTTLERIILCAKSEMAFHRVIVSRSLPTWIRDVELSEAVEYVVALLNGLATDEKDVCAAFASEFHHVMWYFYQNCPLVEQQGSEDPPQEGRTEEQREHSEVQDGGTEPPADEDKELAKRPRIPVGVFTPLICALLLNQMPVVAETAQASLVTFFQWLKATKPASEGDQEPSQDQRDEEERNAVVTHAEGRDGMRVPYESYQFSQNTKAVIIDELLQHVVYSMGRLPSERPLNGDDSGPPDSNGDGSSSGEGSATNDDQDQGEDPSDRNGNDDADTSWDAEMQDESQNLDDWRRAGSPFDSSSPMFSAYDKPDVDEEAAIGRMASVSLLGALSAEAAVDVSEISSRFVAEITSLKDDPKFYVRKEAAAALGPLSKHLSGDDVVERLFPVFDAFCEDKIWHVRQAACCSLPAMFKHTGGELRQKRVVSLLRSFSSDVSRNVRAAALEIIGEVIYLFDGDEAGVPPELVRFFLGEPFDEPSTNGNGEDGAGDASGENSAPSPSGSGSYLFSDFGFGAAMNPSGGAASHGRKESHWGTEFMPSLQASDPDRPLVMAINFPAVLLTLKGDAWPRLRQVHSDLSMDPLCDVRRSLAASLHEIAKLINADAARDDLLPVLERFLTEDDGSIKAAALENVNVFLAQLPRDAAIQTLGCLRDLWSTSFAHDWRLRESLALQIPALAEHFVLEDEEGSLMSLMQTALSDPISAVRDAGVKASPSLYHNFAEHDQTVADGVLGMLADMGEATSYRVRVGFLLAAHALVESRVQRSSFQLIVLPRLVALASDPVVDVRMALARIVAAMCSVEELFASPQSRDPARAGGEQGGVAAEMVSSLLRQLASDPSAYVRSRVAGLFGPDDPLSTAAPREDALSGQRRDLTLGPADGGPHRPEKPNGHGGAGPNSSFLARMQAPLLNWDDDNSQPGAPGSMLLSGPSGSGQGGDLPPFAMDEDYDFGNGADGEMSESSGERIGSGLSYDRHHPPYHHFSYGQGDGEEEEGGVQMSEHDIDSEMSDMELINIDGDGDGEGDGEGDDIDADASMFEDDDPDDDGPSPFTLSQLNQHPQPHSGPNRNGWDGSFEQDEEEEPHHLMTVGCDDDGDDDAASNAAFNSLGLSGAGVGTSSPASGFLSLTSPERSRVAFIGGRDLSLMGHARAMPPASQAARPQSSSAEQHSDGSSGEGAAGQDAQAGSSPTEATASADSTATAEQQGTGSGSPRARDSSSADPFLSFVSNELGPQAPQGANAKGGAAADAGADTNGSPKAEVNGGAGGGEGEERPAE